MALLDRLKERIQTDLTDTELQFILDEANAAIIQARGPHSDPALPITVDLSPVGSLLLLPRRIDSAHQGGSDIVVKEYLTRLSSQTALTLAFNDYRVLYRGWALERLVGGTNSRDTWTMRVTVQFIPEDDGNQRQEAILQLSILAIRYQGLATELVGDVRFSYADYCSEREKVLAALAGGPVIA